MTETQTVFTHSFFIGLWHLWIKLKCEKLSLRQLFEGGHALFTLVYVIHVSGSNKMISGGAIHSTLDSVMGSFQLTLHVIASADWSPISINYPQLTHRYCKYSWCNQIYLS